MLLLELIVFVCIKFWLKLVKLLVLWKSVYVVDEDSGIVCVLLMVIIIGDDEDVDFGVVVVV